MNATGSNALARALRGFFADHLPRVRGSSPHTVLQLSRQPRPLPALRRPIDGSDR